MKAIRVARSGGPEEMALVDVETPAPGPGEVRVAQHASGINFIDVYKRNGLYPQKLPTGLGEEGAGVVEATGEGVRRFAVGDRIAYCAVPVGTYAERYVVREDRAVKLPEAISFEVAAASMLKGMTARFLLRKTFPVERGHSIVIYAAAGGVGQIVVQWAAHLGATVIAVVGSDAKAEIPRGLGAQYVIVSAHENIAARVREITNGVGADVVYDPVGKDTWEASLDSLRPRGLMVSFGNASGPVGLINPLTLAQKGSLFLTRPTLHHYIAAPAEFDETAADLFAVIESGAVKIAAPTRYALADAAQAHRDLEARKTSGSLVLIP